MKKILFALALFVFSCTSISRIPEVKNLYTIDFTSYTEKGFLFTPYEYSDKYESIASINFEYFPQAIRTGELPGGLKYDKKVDNAGMAWKVEELNVDEIIEGIYQYSKNKGANAIVDIKITSVDKTIAGLTISGLTITGFAIKRK